MPLSEYQECLDYIERTWHMLSIEQKTDDQTLIGLPRPYITPSAEMFREMYYWDSYFTGAGLRHTDHYQWIFDMADNMAYLMDRFGKIPNANRYYFLSRSQPPFFARTICLCLDVIEDRKLELDLDWLSRMYGLAAEELSRVWLGNEFPDVRCIYRGLSRYYDLNYWHNAAEAESGWDMTSRFSNRCLDFLPIDLNCILYQYEKDLSLLAEMLDRPAEAQDYKEQAASRAETMHELLWNEDSGIFVDFDFIEEEQSKIFTAASLFPLWSRLATPEQAAMTVERLEKDLETDFGVLTTEKKEHISGIERGQWDYPNGWAPLHFITVQGLLNYGYHDSARRIARKWNNLVKKVFEESEVMHEKYDVVQGSVAKDERYEHQSGFGWTNAVFIAFDSFLSKPEMTELCS